MATHSLSATFPTITAAAAFADAFIADSNAADFVGTPATSYEIFEVSDLYGTRYEVAFTAAFAVAAGVAFGEAA